MYKVTETIGLKTRHFTLCENGELKHGRDGDELDRLAQAISAIDWGDIWRDIHGGKSNEPQE